MFDENLENLTQMSYFGPESCLQRIYKVLIEATLLLIWKSIIKLWNTYIKWELLPIICESVEIWDK